MNYEKSWRSLCSPAQLYPIIMTGVVLFSLWRGAYRHAVTQTVGLFAGTFFLWLLCKANFEFVAWALLALPVIFLIFFLAIVIFDQSLIQVKHHYKKRCGCPTETPCGCQSAFKQY
jgi:prolipoprotein diacylglyceryltransferase